MNWENVNFPASFDDITTFETNNKICVNIFGHCGEKNETSRTYTLHQKRQHEPIIDKGRTR